MLWEGGVTKLLNREEEPFLRDTMFDSWSHNG
jgi:hypothetical protein